MSVLHIGFSVWNRLAPTEVSTLVDISCSANSSKPSEMWATHRYWGQHCNLIQLIKLLGWRCMAVFNTVLCLCIVLQAPETSQNVSQCSYDYKIATRWRPDISENCWTDFFDWDKHSNLEHNGALCNHKNVIMQSLRWRIEIFQLFPLVNLFRFWNPLHSPLTSTTSGSEELCWLQT